MNKNLFVTKTVSKKSKTIKNDKEKSSIKFNVENIK